MPTESHPRTWRALALALACALPACSHPPADHAAAAATTPTNVRLSTAQLRHLGLLTLATTNIHSTLPTIGTVDFDPDHAASVIAPFTGPVLRVLVTPGQTVRAGEALAIVDSADYAAAVASVVKARQTARNLDQIAHTDADLLAHRGVSARENQQAHVDAASADADLAAARQSLLALGADPSELARTPASTRATLRAPIGGTVAEKLIAPGTLLQAGSTACFTIANLSRVWVLAQLSTAESTRVAIGDPVDVLAPDTPRPLAGRVVELSPVVDPDTRAIIARVAVDNPGNVLKKQMYVRVEIRSRQARPGILAPDSAILRDDENLPFVYVRLDDGSFARRHVTLGARQRDAYTITAGLRAGERIVANGSLFLQFMQAQ